jgi:hypothetical protein
MANPKASPQQFSLFSEAGPSEVEATVIRDLKARIEARVVENRKGTKCPCCDRFVKIYERVLNAQMALALIAIYKHFRTDKTPGSYLHVPGYLMEHQIMRADEAKLVYWGILEALKGLREDGSKRNGYYRITPKGIDFVRGKIRVPKYIYTYKTKFLGLSDGQSYPDKSIDITEALGKNFNYREMMDGYDDDVDVDIAAAL